MLAIGSLTASSMVATPPVPAGRAFAKTLPGVTAPLGYFDPMGLVNDLTEEEILLFREAEVMHGRISMMATLGFLVQEKFHPIFPAVGGPGARQLDIVLQSEAGQAAGAVLLGAIFFTEITRARVGWVEPEVEMRTLRKGYTPGDLSFDPLGLKPTTEAGLLEMQTKELQNGRLAMLAVAGIVAQELATDKTLF